MDAVKLTKRDLSYELSDSQMRRPYINKNSFAKTYGEHRAFLELNDEEHFEIYSYAKSENLDFVETLCAPSCLSMLKLFQPDKLKVASRDLTNLPLLQALAETNIPIIVSTGMASDKELDEAIEVISKYHNDISILHCVSQYPTEPKNVNLNTITYLIEKYSDYTIGYSDHTIGIAVPTAAVSMGAKIIEKHITLDRNMKGTDQIGSLGPDGIFRMVRDLRLLEMSFGKKEIFISDDVKLARLKLERSIATNKRLYKGNIITENDIHLLSPGDGYKWSEKEQLIGQRVNCDIPKNELIYSNMLV
ncbi:MAG: N-acetylneuraminate synthase family protein [Bacteroidota bacterium]|nr:N-acetylneuraminate synthase family protein [Bacteroidota bacterium]